MKIAIGIDKPSKGQKILMSLVKRLRDNGKGVGGAIILREPKYSLLVVDLASGERRRLSAPSGSGARFGGRRLDLNSLSKFATEAVESSVSGLEVTVFHEIEPLGLVSPELRKTLEKAVHSDAELVFTYKFGFLDPLVELITSTFKVLTLDDVEKVLMGEDHEGNWDR
ncbi:MAG: hypothetical protein JRN37_05170 [Nitrososphaerota archaeon]|jgi:nucleoside-triphosphatase THEP1|nr:hypothetical protein [Nitrososphaerota archaeon]MDG7038532.1 hypothetical protein [Nitrososphaerota archaeon]